MAAMTSLKCHDCNSVGFNCSKFLLLVNVIMHRVEVYSQNVGADIDEVRALVIHPKMPCHLHLIMTMIFRLGSHTLHNI